jgi:hypothetical protein
MTVVHEGSDHKLHNFLQVTREDGSHDEVQLPDEEEGES